MQSAGPVPPSLALPFLVMAVTPPVSWLTSVSGVLLAIRLALLLVSNLGAMVRQDTGRRWGRYPIVMKSSCRISATLGLLSGSCCSSFWMRFLARGPTLLGTWYSFFLILV